VQAAFLKQVAQQPGHRFGGESRGGAGGEKECSDLRLAGVFGRM
jgi:hypothetical protein